MAWAVAFAAVLFSPWLVALSASVASTQGDDNRYIRQVREQLRRAGESLERQGFELAQSVYTGSLDDGESESLTITLPFRTGGYRLVGVCDNDCDDLDLVFMNLYGETIAEDLEPDDLPVLMIASVGHTRYRLRVNMASCSSSPCWYGVGVFGRNR